MSAPKVLVVANPYEAARCAAWLGGSDLAIERPVRTGDGGDDTLTDFAGEPADVVVLAATLATGDAEHLASALRSEGPKHLKIILVGDDQGPVRTALDAAAYGADKFLRRPLAPNALVFAVRTCLPGAAPVQVGGIIGGIAGVAAAAAGSGKAQAAAALAQVVQAPARALTAPSGVSEALAGIDASGLAGLADLAARLDAVTTSMVDEFLGAEVERSLRATVGSGVAQAVEYVAEPGDAERELMAPQKTADFQRPAAIAAPRPTETEVPPPPEREPTLILSAGVATSPAPPPPAVAVATPTATTMAPPPSPPAAPPEAPSDIPTDGGVDTGAGTNAGVGPTAPAAAGTLARELRRTMSAIEKRLFGDDVAEGDSVADMTDDAVADDIDLDKIGSTTSPGLASDLAEGGTLAAPAGAPTFVGTGLFDDSATESALRSDAALAEPARVDLADEDAATLLARLYREAWTGRATFRQGDAQKLVYFDGGRPVFATSNLPHDRMGDLLWREGKITRAQWSESRAIVAETGRRMGEILVEKGFLKRRELLPAVRRHLEDVIYSLFSWDRGEVELSAGDAARDEKIRLATHPTALVFEGVRRKMNLGHLRERLGGDDTIVVPLKRDEIGAALAEADLSLDERALADLFDGRRSFADVSVAARQDLTTVYQLAYALVALGLLRAFERGREHSEPGRPPPGAAAVQTPQLSGAVDVAIDRERVLAKHALVLEADYFMVLGVRADASAFEVKRAWEAARRDYSPEAFPLEVQRELAEPLREIAAVLDEAYHVLRDNTVRARYLANLGESV